MDSWPRASLLAARAPPVILVLRGVLPIREVASWQVNLSDAIAILCRIFLGAPPLPAPYPGPGVDPTPDDLFCLRA